MSWQPMITAPMDGQRVWVTLDWYGHRWVIDDSWPYISDSIVWHPFGSDKTPPEPYTGTVQDLVETYAKGYADGAMTAFQVALEKLRSASSLAEAIASVSAVYDRMTGDPDIMRKLTEVASGGAR